MTKATLLPTWAPRIKPYLVRRLYESDASGMLDYELLEQVGWALHARCDSFLLADEAVKGRLRCPACAGLILHDHKPKQILHCALCGWECSWGEIARTIKNQQLSGGPEVIELFQQFRDDFPKEKNAAQKMLLIDALIHGFHHFLRSGRTRRPVGVNLIDGNLDFVVDFLDHLSAGPGSTPGIQQSLQQWQNQIHYSFKRKK